MVLWFWIGKKEADCGLFEINVYNNNSMILLWEESFVVFALMATRRDENRIPNKFIDENRIPIDLIKGKLILINQIDGNSIPIYSIR